MFNSVFLKGNLVRDPELRSVGETHVANFTIACNRKFKRANGDTDQEVTYVDCELWDTAAERFTDWCAKGDSVSLQGALKTDTWESQDGTKKSRLKVRVQNFERNRTAKDFDGSAPAKTENKEPAGSVVDDGGGENIPF